MECPKVITSAYDFIKWAIPHIAKFPRDQRYTLGDRIEGKLFYLLDLLIEAQYSKDKFGALKAANLGIEQMRHLFSLCYDLRLINLKTFEMIRKKIKDPDVLWLIKLIIDSTVPPGIPIGNLASQIFANLYLNELDHYLKETIKCRHYIRYMDDLIVFNNDKDRLNDIKRAIDEHLKCLKLEFHPHKSQTHLVARGTAFLGYKIFPTHRLVIRQNVKRLRSRIKRYYKMLRLGLIMSQKILCSIQGWLGYAIHADSFHMRRRILSEFNFMGISP